MEKSSNLLKAVLPSIVRNVSDFISVKVEISLFGQKIFEFVWPPKKTDSNSDV